MDDLTHLLLTLLLWVFVIGFVGTLWAFVTSLHVEDLKHRIDVLEAARLGPGRREDD